MCILMRNMATTALNLAFLLLIICTAQSSTAEPNPQEFVKTSCRATRYPLLCVHSLLAYATVIRRSDRQLAMAALSVTISRTRSSASFVKNMSKARGVRKGREWRAVQDCVENMGDSVERLRQSVRELGRSGGPAGEDFVWHMSNVQTWVSAALTDDNTCLDGFGASASVKGGIKDRVLRVAQLTSNALAFVNRFASTHPTPQTP